MNLRNTKNKLWEKLKKSEIPVVILCGGRGTRLKEETEVIPKPMVKIGERPILWHIMKIYHSQGFRKFILPIGYKGEKIKEYFNNYHLYSSDFVIKPDGNRHKVTFFNKPQENWEVTIIDTGPMADTGGRLKKVTPYLKTPLFMFTYGDGVADVDLNKLLTQHQKSNFVLTMTAVTPPGRFGEIMVVRHSAVGFKEKPEEQNNRINGGFFVVNREIANFMSDKETLSFEKEVLPPLFTEKKVGLHLHDGYWQCMDTVKDMETLNSVWSSGKAPWKIWKD